MNISEIGKRAAYKVTLKDKGQWVYEFECIESGAQAYGNRTAVTLDVIDTETGVVVNEDLFDTRYLSGVTFERWVWDYMQWAVNPLAVIEEFPSREEER